MFRRFIENLNRSVIYDDPVWSDFNWFDDLARVNLIKLLIICMSTYNPVHDISQDKLKNAINQTQAVEVERHLSSNL